MKIVFIGDVVGNPGREAIKTLLPQLKEELAVDFFIVNSENAAGGAGITPKVAGELFQSGVDVITSGDHIWDRRELLEAMSEYKQLLRPANYPQGAPGFGWCIAEKERKKIAVVNLQGRVFMPPTVDNPFRCIGSIVEQLRSQATAIIVDMHAEATSEKVAMGRFLDGQVSAVVGTHTHVQTADETILLGGTAYITDAGMTGPCDSVIGQRTDKIIERFYTGLPTRFEVALSDVQLQAVAIDIADETGKAQSIQRLKRGL